jgi:hypothetical protein
MSFPSFAHQISQLGAEHNRVDFHSGRSVLIKNAPIKISSDMWQRPLFFTKAYVALHLSRTKDREIDSFYEIILAIHVVLLL